MMINSKILTYTTAVVLFLFCLVSGRTAEAAVSITRTSAPVFYSDIGNGLSGGYVAYRISTDTAITDAWAQIGNFSGPYISLGTAETGLYHLGPLAPGSSMAYFYLKTSAVSAVSESHTVTVYDGKPPGGTALGSLNSTLTQQNTIQANSNKVSSVVTGPTTIANLGSVVTLTVTGDTGTTGGTLAFTAATEPNWPASSYKLFRSVINLPDNSVLTDAPYTSAYYGTSGTYVAVYSFIAENTVTAPSATNATGYILSGQQMKHTQVGGSAGAPPPPTVNPSSGNTVLLSNSVSYPPITPGVAGTATFTLTLTNTGTSSVTVDNIVNTLPATPGVASYVAGSSTYAGNSFADPVISGSQLTWSSSFAIPAGESRRLTFVANIPGNTGTYTDSAVAHIGSVQIDTTYDTTDNSPATSTVTVAAVSVLSKLFNPSTIGVGQTSTLSFTITNSPDKPVQNGLAFTDILPARLTVTGTPTPQCGGSLSSSVNGSGASVITFSGGSLAAGAASCTINTTVTGYTDGLYSNSYAAGNLTNLSANLVGTGVSASLQVSAPTVTTQFSPSTINSNQSSSLMFTINNGTGYPSQSGLGFSESLPAGLAVIGAPTYSDGCTWAYSVATDNKSFTLSAGTMAVGTQSCMVMVPVAPTAPTVTTYTNYPSYVSVSGGLVSGVTNQTLVVTSTPTLKKVFSPLYVGFGLPSVLSFTINNSSNSTQSNLSFSDLFPGNLVVYNPPALSFSGGCSSGNVYRFGSTSGTLQGGEPGIAVSGVAVAPNSTCTISMNVTSAITGSYLNTWSNSANSNISNLSGLAYAESNLTNLSVVGVKVTKAFGDPLDISGLRYNLVTGASTPLIFTISNDPNKPAQGGIRFSDTLPRNLSATGPLTTSQCGGTVGYSVNSSGDSVINFSSGALALNADSCTITTYVTSTTPSTYTNGPTNFGSLPDSGVDVSNASSRVYVYNPPALVITRSASPASAQPTGVVTYTMQVTNQGGPATNVVAYDTMSPYTSLVLNPSLWTGGPFNFQDVNSNLSPATPLYSNDGINWSSTPPPNGNVTYWKIPMNNMMNGASGTTYPSFTITWQALVK